MTLERLSDPQPLDSSHPTKAVQRSTPKSHKNTPTVGQLPPHQRCPTLTPWQTVTTYRSRNLLYYRYRHGIGHRTIASIYIPGGNTLNPIAQGRAYEVARWIARGEPPATIVELINRWRSDGN